MKVLLLQGDVKSIEFLWDLLGKMGAGFTNFLGALLIFFIGWIVARIVARLIKRLLKSIGIDKLAARLN